MLNMGHLIIVIGNVEVFCTQNVNWKIPEL